MKKVLLISIISMIFSIPTFPQSIKELRKNPEDYTLIHLTDAGEFFFVNHHQTYMKNGMLFLMGLTFRRMNYYRFSMIRANCTTFEYLVFLEFGRRDGEGFRNADTNPKKEIAEDGQIIYVAITRFCRSKPRKR